jgi:hypothetical protein
LGIEVCIVEREFGYSRDRVGTHQPHVTKNKIYYIIIKLENKMTPEMIITTLLIVFFGIVGIFAILRSLDDEKVDETTQPPRDDKVTWWPEEKDDS